MIHEAELHTTGIDVLLYGDQARNLMLECVMQGSSRPCRHCPKRRCTESHAWQMTHQPWHAAAGTCGRSHQKSRLDFCQPYTPTNVPPSGAWRSESAAPLPAHTGTCAACRCIPLQACMHTSTASLGTSRCKHRMHVRISEGGCSVMIPALGKLSQRWL